MRLVIIESPYSGNTDLNAKYARAAMADCFQRGEAPFASHLLYTQPGVLRDDVKEERAKGIAAGWNWMTRADLVAVYTDLGITSGMKEGIGAAKTFDKPIEYRSLRKSPDEELE
jgi:hypothetical protein